MQTTVTQLKAILSIKNFMPFLLKSFFQYFHYFRSLKKTYERALGEVIAFVFIPLVSTTMYAFGLRFKF